MSSASGWITDSHSPQIYRVNYADDAAISAIVKAEGAAWVWHVYDPERSAVYTGNAATKKEAKVEADRVAEALAVERMLGGEGAR